MRVDGKCHCGHVRFEGEVDPEKVSICHCTDCQTISGSAFRVNVPVSVESFRITAGEPAVYVKRTADSGRSRGNVFCPQCGTALCAVPHEEQGHQQGGIVMLRVGVLAQRDQLPPRVENWTRSMQHWMRDALPLPKKDRV